MPAKQCQQEADHKNALGWVAWDTDLHFLTYILQLCLEFSNPIPHLQELYFAKPSVNTIRSLSNAPRLTYLAAFWHFNRGLITAKNLILCADMWLKTHHCHSWLFHISAQVPWGHAVRFGYHFAALGAFLSSCKSSHRYKDGLYI